MVSPPIPRKTVTWPVLRSRVGGGSGGSGVAAGVAAVVVTVVTVVTVLVENWWWC